MSDKKSDGSCNSTGIYYKVEVRRYGVTPKVLQTDNPRTPFVIDDKWKEWPVTLVLGPAPAPSMPVRFFDRHATEHGLLTYEAAMGHLHGIFALLETTYDHYCVQCRLVAYDWEERYSYTEKSVGAPIIEARRPWDDFKTRAEADKLAMEQAKANP